MSVFPTKNRRVGFSNEKSTRRLFPLGRRYIIMYPYYLCFYFFFLIMVRYIDFLFHFLLIAVILLTGYTFKSRSNCILVIRYIIHIFFLKYKLHKFTFHLYFTIINIIKERNKNTQDSIDTLDCNIPVTIFDRIYYRCPIGIFCSYLKIKYKNFTNHIMYRLTTFEQRDLQLIEHFSTFK